MVLASGGEPSARQEVDMPFVRNEGTSYIDAGLARVNASLCGILGFKAGIFQAQAPNQLVANTIPSTTAGAPATVNIPRNCLNTNNKSLRISAWGTVNAAAGAKVVRLVVVQGGTTVVVATMLPAGGVAATWTLSGIFIRTGAQTQVFKGEGRTGTAAQATINGIITSSTSTLFAIRAMAVSVQVTNIVDINDTVTNNLMVELYTEGSIPTI